MKPIPRLVAILLAAPLLCAAAPAPPPVIQPLPWPAPAGSTQLWNATDLTGWVPFFKGGIQPPAAFWSAVGGVLRLAGKPTGYIRTIQSYGNYHLHAEWRWASTPAKGVNNSGIFVLQRAPDVVWPFSVQVQVKAGSCGDLIAQGGLLFTPGQTNMTAKKLVADSEKPAGEWNAYDIYLRGNSLEIYVNSIRQNYVDQLPATDGQIALQMEGYPIDFRNLWLQPIPTLPTP